LPSSLHPGHCRTQGRGLPPDVHRSREPTQQAQSLAQAMQEAVKITSDIIHRHGSRDALKGSAMSPWDRGGSACPVSSEPATKVPFVAGSSPGSRSQRERGTGSPRGSLGACRTRESETRRQSTGGLRGGDPAGWSPVDLPGRSPRARPLLHLSAMGVGRAERDPRIGPRELSARPNPAWSPSVLDPRPPKIDRSSVSCPETRRIRDEETSGSP
jgi:hypothetical protein